MYAISLFIGHMLGDVALPFFYKKIREFNVVYHLIAPVVSFILEYTTAFIRPLIQ